MNPTPHDPTPTNPRGVVLAAGVDWITVTAQQRARSELLAVSGRQWIAEDERRGFGSRDWQWQGYSGQSTKHTQWGGRADGVIARLHGFSAFERWRQAVTFANNVPRLDLAVTVRVEPAGLNVVQLHQADAVAYRQFEPNPPRLVTIQTYGGGSTLYIGARASDRMARLYDKHAESPTEWPPDTWRYEVELKRDAADAVAHALHERRPETKAVVGWVWRHYHDRGCNAIFEPGHEPLLATVPVGRTTIATRLAWLHDSVRPALDYLIARGELETALRMLGLAESPLGPDEADSRAAPVEEPAQGPTM